MSQIYEYGAKSLAMSCNFSLSPTFHLSLNSYDSLITHFPINSQYKSDSKKLERLDV